MNRSGEHLSAEKLREYMNDSLGEQERQEVERELYACDKCLRRWIALEEESDLQRQERADGSQLQQSLDVPSQPDFEIMEEEVIARINAEAQMYDSAEAASVQSQAVSQSWQEGIELRDRSRSPQPILSRNNPYSADATKRRRGSWLRLPAVQYTIAASITILLMAGGALTGLSHTLRDIDQNTTQPPFSSAPEQAGQPLDSWSEHLFDRANHWLEHVESSRFKSNS